MPTPVSETLTRASSAFDAGGNADAAAFAVVADGVGEEVGDDLRDLRNVAFDGRGHEIGFDVDIALGGERSDELDGIFDGLAKVEGGDVEFQAAGVGAGEEEEGFDQALHSAGGFEAGLQGLAVFGGGAIAGEGKLGVGMDDGQRGAKLVGGVGGELDLLGEGAFEAAEGGVEDFGQDGELVGDVFEIDPAGEVAGGDGFGGGADGVDGPDSAAGEKPAAAETDEEDRAAGGGHEPDEAAELVDFGADGPADQDAPAAGVGEGDFADQAVLAGTVGLCDGGGAGLLDLGRDVARGFDDCAVFAPDDEVGHFFGVVAEAVNEAGGRLEVRVSALARRGIFRTRALVIGAGRWIVVGTGWAVVVRTGRAVGVEAGAAIIRTTVIGAAIFGAAIFRRRSSGPVRRESWPGRGGGALGSFRLGGGRRSLASSTLAAPSSSASISLYLVRLISR